jgi:hypothetical protein
MYILKMVLTSSNNEYSLQFTSNGILVKENDTVLVVDVGDPVSYIVFEGDYDALSAANLLEITRAIIYNYLLSIWLSIISYPTIYKGSVAMSFVAGTNQTGTTAAVQSVLSNNNAITNLRTTSIVINGNSFNISSNSTSNNGSSSNGSNSNSSYPSVSNTALIIGLVVGLVGGLIIVLGIIFGYRKYDKQHKHRLLKDDYNENNEVDNIAVQNNDNMISSSPTGANVIVPLITATTIDGLKSTQRVSSSVPVSPNRLDLPSTCIEVPRTPSAAISITMLDAMVSNEAQRPISSLPHVELIKFD